MQSDSTLHGLPLDLSKNFSLDPNLFFYCWSKFIAQGVNIPKLMSVSLALCSASREARLHALLALSKLGNSGRSQRLQACGCWVP